MKKKILIILAIYISGCILSYNISINHIKSYKSKLKYNNKITYGDVAFSAGMSLFSWLDVAALGFIKLSDSNIWDKPVKKYNEQ